MESINNTITFRIFVKVCIFIVLFLNAISVVFLIMANTNLFNTYDSLCDRIQTNREIELDTYDIVRKKIRIKPNEKLGKS